jgi:magnesium chelatase subunit D
MMDGGEVWADAVLAAALLAVDPGLGGGVIRAGPGPVRDAWLAGLRRMTPADCPWRRLPPGIDDERLLGGLDLAAALGAGRRVLQRGLLAEVNGGVLVAPMAERLAATTAARLAGAIDQGTVLLERDGFTDTLTTRFVMIALDEGVEPEEQPPAALAERLAFHLDLTGVAVREASPTTATADDIAEAKAALARVESIGAEALQAICAAASALGVESLRAPLLALRAARTLAALEHRTTVDEDDLRTAARLVLGPRATRAPAAAAQDGDTPERESPEARATDARDVSQEAEANEDFENPAPSLAEIVLAAVRAALPDGLDSLWTADGARSRAVPAGARGAGRMQPTAKRGRRIGVRAGLPRGASDLDSIETLKAAAPWQRLRAAQAQNESRAKLRVRRDDFRVRRFEQRAESTVIFVVDASGSSALQRLAEAKGAVELLLGEAYVRRTQVALIAFRGAGAELLLPPTRSLTRARRALAELAGGGATPLATALDAGGALALAERAKGRTPLLVVLTDGRGNIALDGAAFRTRAETDALAAARRIGGSGVAAALIDTSPRPRGEGARLAEAMGARFAPLPYVEAGAVRAVVRELDAEGRR